MQYRRIGAGVLAELPGLVLRQAPEGPVLVLGGMHGFPDSAEAALVAGLGARVRILRVPGALPDTDSHARILAAVPDLPATVVGIGGGRVLDLAKLLSTGRRDGAALVAELDAGRAPERRTGLIAVPTTAGSGSESTPFAVLYHQGRKLSLDHPSLLPDVALVDPALMGTAPAGVRASSGLDALCQGIEAQLSRRATPLSSVHGAAAVARAVPALRGAVSGDPTAMIRLAEAANLAGRAIAITRTTVPHALSYPLTSGYGVPHGHAVALSMGRYLAHLGRQIALRPELARWQAAHDGVLAALGCGGPDEVAERWQALVADLGLGPDLAACGIPARARQEAAAAVNPARLGNAPLEFDAETLAGLIA